MIREAKYKRGIRSFMLMLAAGCTLVPALAYAQSEEANPPESHEQGFPVTDALTITKCGACHQQDAKGNLSRISWIRTSPEGWEEAIKRMLRLNGLSLTPEEARHILRYLSDQHGLAPSEAIPVEDYAEHRIIDEKFPADPNVRGACAACHELARPLSWHRPPDDWKLLVNMHLAYFPSSAPIAFGTAGRNLENGAASKERPVDAALAYIEKSSPLHTAAWSKWQASETTPNLSGRWLVSGDEPGKGKFYGEMTITPGADGEFATKSSIHFIKDPSHTLTTQGSSIVYTGYQWRGRSTSSDAEGSPLDLKEAREVMLVSADQSEIKGRWFWGRYQEMGMDITLHRATDGPSVLGTDLYSLKAGSTDNQVVIYGDHLPQNANDAAIDLGAGVKVTKVVSSTPTAITVTADVAADAMPGPRTIAVGGSAAPDALAVYKSVDFIKVLPRESLAHLGSTNHTKGYVQFVAEAFSNGPDGKPYTADDIDLGPVAAKWSLHEFVATYGDDDVKYVGQLDPDTGFFTPSSDGPSPTRTSSRNNYGDVMAVATVTPAGASMPLTGSSYLIVTVPQYQIYDQPEVGQ